MERGTRSRWLEEKEDDGRPEQHGVGAAVGSVGAAAGSGRVGGPLPEGGGEERRDHGVLRLRDRALAAMQRAAHIFVVDVDRGHGPGGFGKRVVDVVDELE